VAPAVAYRLHEVMAILPDHPGNAVANGPDAWAAAGRPQPLGQRAARVIELQSEGGAAGCCMGALRRGTRLAPSPRRKGLLLMPAQPLQNRR